MSGARWLKFIINIFGPVSSTGTVNDTYKQMDIRLTEIKSCEEEKEILSYEVLLLTRNELIGNDEPKQAKLIMTNYKIAFITTPSTYNIGIPLTIIANFKK